MEVCISVYTALADFFNLAPKVWGLKHTFECSVGWPWPTLFQHSSAHNKQCFEHITKEYIHSLI